MKSVRGAKLRALARLLLGVAHGFAHSNGIESGCEAEEGDRPLGSA